VIQAIESWLLSSPNPRIADLLAQSGMSEAQAQHHSAKLMLPVLLTA
jgi:hypothetical protein